MRSTTISTLTIAVLMSLFCLAGAGQQAITQEVFSIQKAIDAAYPGEIVRVPAGIYHEHIKLAEGVILMGEGAGATILDGNGEGTVVTGANNAMIIGFTIRNGVIGVDTRHSLTGVFNNIIEDNRHIGVHVSGSGAVILNNIFKNNGGLGAIACNSSMPLIAHNNLMNNETGVWTWWPTGPSIVNNIFSGNRFGVMAGAGAEPYMDSNIFSDNQQDCRGIGIGEGDMVVDKIGFKALEEGDLRLSAESVALASAAPIPGYLDEMAHDIGVEFNSKANLDHLRAVMSKVEQDLVEQMPLVHYDLSDELGLFYVTTMWPVSNFAVRASTPDTKVRAFDAFDTMEELELTAEFSNNEYPTVMVRSDQPDFRRELDRYWLDMIYYHEGSYYLNELNQLVFERTTTFSRIEVAIPAGYTIVDINYPASFEKRDGRIIAVIKRMGETNLRIVMERITPYTTDPFELESM